MKKSQIKILVSMYAGYAAFMICRNTLIASSAAMIQDPTLGLDKEAFGQLMSWHSAGAIAGKLVTGILADLLGGRIMFLSALALTAVANLGFAAVSSFLFFGLLNFAGQFFKAGGWPAMAKIIGNWYSPKQYGKVWSIISTSSRVGTIIAGVLLGAMLSFVSWRSVFVFSAVITGVVIVFAYFFLKEKPEDGEVTAEDLHYEQHRFAQNKKHPFDHLKLGGAIWEFARSGRFWLICFGLCFLTILMDFINFIPIYLTETLQISAGEAAMSGSVFPAGMFIALIACGFVYDRLSKKQLTWVLGSLLLVSTLCAAALWALPSLPVSADNKLHLSLFIIFIFGFAISPAYYIPMSIFAIAFGGKFSGFLIALIDVFGYLGAMVFNFWGGSIAQHYGWAVFLTVLISVTVLALTTMTSFLALDARAETSG